MRMSLWNCGHMDYLGECSVCAHTLSAYVHVCVCVLGGGGEIVAICIHPHTPSAPYRSVHACDRCDQCQLHHVDEPTQSTVGPPASEPCDLCR